MLPLSIPFTAGQTATDDQLRRTAASAYDAAMRMYRYFNQFEERIVTTADGERIKVLALRLGTGDTTGDFGWFATTDISQDGAFRIRVGPGRFSCADPAGIDSATPTLAEFVREISVSGGDFSVQNGSQVYLKVTAGTIDASQEYSNESQSPADPSGGPSGGGTYTAEDLITVTVTNKGTIWHGVSGEIVVTTTPPTGDATTGYVLLTEIAISDGAMTIMRRRRTVDISVVTGVFGGPVVVDANIEDQLTCSDGESHTCSYLAKTSLD